MSMVYEWFGGRKQFNTYLALVIAIVYAVAADQGPDFLVFMGVIGGILGIGNFSIAYEDRNRGSAR